MEVAQQHIPVHTPSAFNGSFEMPEGYPARPPSVNWSSNSSSQRSESGEDAPLAYPPFPTDLRIVPAVVGVQYCAPCAVHLVAQKCGANFTIADGTGRHLFLMNGKMGGKQAPSLHSRRILRDSAGNVAATLQRKVLSMHDSWEVYAGDTNMKTDLAFIMKKAHVINHRQSYNIFVAYRIGHDIPDFIVRGDFGRREYVIYYRNHRVAEVSKTYSVGVLSVGKDSYGANVRPDVDTAFIASVIILLDNIHADKEE